MRYDQRAHGRSTRGTALITLEGLADDLAHVIDRLAPHGPLVLAGHSMGGMILQTLTTLRPDLLPRFRGLLLISTPDGPVTTRPQPGLRTRIRGWGRDLLAVACTRAPSAMDAVRRRLPHSSPWTLRDTEPRSGDTDSPLPCRRGLHRTATRDIASFWQPLATSGSRPVAGLLALGPRLTLLAGTADAHVPAGHTRALAHRVPQAQFVLAEQATHTLPVRHPQLIVDILACLASQAALQHPHPSHEGCPRQTARSLHHHPATGPAVERIHAQPS